MNNDAKSRGKKPVNSPRRAVDENRGIPARESLENTASENTASASGALSESLENRASENIASATCAASEISKNTASENTASENPVSAACAAPSIPEGPVIPVIIPAYEPDRRLIGLLEDFREKKVRDVILVNDGSGDKYEEIFEEAGSIVKELGGTVLVHEVNRGKGRALKTGFAYVLENYPEAIGTVTADSDGQHSPECILSVMQRLREKPDSLVLGVRSFNEEQVPWKSRMGNKLTLKVLGYVSGIHVSDTQTGLRGIPRAFMRDLLDVEGERFEFETRMLLETAGKCDIEEVTIRTIYDSKEDHQTHFDPFRDSIRIYKILGAKFLKYIAASLSSSVIDIGLFTVFCSLMRGKIGAYIAVSTILARILSASYNFLMNYRVVFKSSEHMGSSAVRYVALAATQMLLSAALVTGGASILTFLPEVIVKIIVDTILFLLSFYIQRKYVF